MVAGQLSWRYAGAFLVVTPIADPAQTLATILIEDVSYERYRGRDLARLAGWAILETV